MTLVKKEKKKGFRQQELTQFDENIRHHYEQIEDEIFDRRERLSSLENGMSLQNNTILGALFQEIRRQNDETEKKSTKKNKVRLFKVSVCERASRKSKRFIVFLENLEKRRCHPDVTVARTYLGVSRIHSLT